MLVVQIFVMKNGAFQGVEMACGERVLVGPAGADVPLAEVTDSGVQLTQDGDTLYASPLGDDVRVDGERLARATALTAQSDVVIGAYTLKFRQQAVRQAPALPHANAMVPASVTMADTVAEAVTAAEEPGTPAAWWTTFDEPKDELADDAEDIDWSLVQALARPVSGSGARFVEVVEVCGERALGHALLDGTQAYLHDGRALVRRRADGACEVFVPVGGAVRALRKGATQDLFARDGALSLVLAQGDAANVRVGARQLLVRFTSLPSVTTSLEDRLLQRAEQRLQAACAGVGMGLCSLWGGAAWLLAYRDREELIPLDDEDVTQWQDVELVMTPPKAAPPPIEPLTEPRAEPIAEPAASEATAARGSMQKEQAAAVRAQRPLDVLKSLPALQTNRALDLAFTNVRAPLPSRPGGPILQPMVGRGGGAGDVEIGGSGLDTGSASKGLKAGAGGLAARESRDIGGGVARAKLRNLTASSEQGLSKDEILRVINARIGEIQVCYEKGLRGDAKLGGRIEVEWIINETGRVVRTRLESSTLPSDAVVRCMLDRIETWRFPRAKTPSQVSYPFSFASL